MLGDISPGKLVFSRPPPGGGSSRSLVLVPFQASGRGAGAIAPEEPTLH